MAIARRRGVKLKLTVPDQSELEIHRQIAQYLDACLLGGAQWTSLAVGHALLTAGETSRLVLIGVKSGWPDIVLVWSGTIFGFEIKTRTGELSKTRIVRTKSGALREVVGQVERFQLLEKAGMRVTVVRSLDEMIAALDACGIPHRGPYLPPGGGRLGHASRTESSRVFGGVNPTSPSSASPRPREPAKRARAPVSS
jgi:hypothetical protein